jgi:uncharacterized protein (TIGR02118 family)
MCPACPLAATLTVPRVSPGARMVVTYGRPKDKVAFDRHYFGVHVPMAQKLPGLRRYMVSKASDAARADDAYLVATLDFDSLEATRAAFESDVGRACRQAGSKIEIEVGSLDSFMSFSTI